MRKVSIRSLNRQCSFAGEHDHAACGRRATSVVSHIVNDEARLRCRTHAGQWDEEASGPITRRIPPSRVPVLV